MSPDRTIIGRYLGLMVMVTAALLLLGYAPTRRLGGEEAVPAMLVGCAISVVASVVGTLPVFLARNRPHLEAWTAAMVAMAVRLGIAIVLGVALALSGVFATKPLLIWVAVGHAAFLVPDTLFSIKVLAQQALAEDR